MQEFIQAAMQKFGMSEQGTKSITGGLLQTIEGNVDQADFKELIGKVPGSQELVNEASAASESSSGGKGIMGGLLGTAASALGGKSASLLGVMDLFKEGGLSLDNAGDFVSMLTNFLKEKAGGGLVDKIVGQVPDLKKLLG